MVKLRKKLTIAIDVYVLSMNKFSINNGRKWPEKLGLWKISLAARMSCRPLSFDWKNYQGPAVLCMLFSRGLFCVCSSVYAQEIYILWSYFYLPMWVLFSRGMLFWALRRV